MRWLASDGALTYSHMTLSHQNLIFKLNTFKQDHLDVDLRLTLSRSEGKVEIASVFGQFMEKLIFSD